MVEELGFCDNPVDFKYYGFYEVYHPELAPLCQLDHEDVEQEGAAFAPTAYLLMTGTRQARHIPSSHPRKHKSHCPRH